MYNDEMKRRFIRSYTNSISTANVCEALFNAMEKYEREWGADVCTQSVETLQPMVDKLIGLRAKSRLVKFIILKDYVRWCMALGFHGACDDISKVDTIGLSSMKERTVSSPAHLEQYLNKIFSPAKEQRSDNTQRCYHWLAYAGFSESEALEIRVSDVDFLNMVVRHEGVEGLIYREAVAAYRNCVELSQFLYANSRYGKRIWRDRVPGDKLLRGIRAEPSAQLFRSKIAKSSRDREGATNMRLSYYKVWLSGLFYRTYEKERMGVPPNFSDIVAHQSVGKTYKLDSGRNTQEAKHRQLERDYFNDYQRWKLAFGM